MQITLNTKNHINILKRRKLKNNLMSLVIYALSLLAIIPLMLVFYHILKNGFEALNFKFFTELPVPMGDTGGGMANSICGSLILICLSSLVAVPLGIAGGLYLSEYKNERLAKILRWTVDLLMSIPSIVIGLFVYTSIVIPFKSFSALAGAAALSLLMLPLVTKTTEEVLKLTPLHLREAALALGLSRWRVILFVVLRGKKPAVVTGVVLALGRIAGETAPLLVTAFGNRNWPTSLLEPTPSMPVQIYNYAISPYAEWHKQAWAGALTLVMLIFFINLLTRLFFANNTSRQTQ